jgi:hypothetical protein
MATKISIILEMIKNLLGNSIDTHSDYTIGFIIGIGIGIFNLIY